MSLLRRILKAMTSGAAATAIDFVTLLGLLQLSHMAAGMAAMLGCLVGATVNYFLARRWVFAGRRADTARQLALYGLLIVVGGAVVGGAIVQVGVDLGVSILAAKTLATVLVFSCWNYPLSELVVFPRG